MEVVDADVAGRAELPQRGLAHLEIHQRKDVAHQVAPDLVAAVGQSVREARRARAEQQRGAADRAGRDDHVARAHLARGAVGGAVVHAARTPLGVHADLERARPGDDFGLAGGARRGDVDRERRGLGIHRAAEARALAAVHALRAPVEDAAVDRHRQREGMQAELLRAGLEQARGRTVDMRRVRVGVRARHLEGVRARPTRDPERLLGLRIEGLELRVADRPVGEVGAGDRAVAAQHAHLVGAEAPAPGAPVHRAAAQRLRQHAVAPGYGRLALVRAQRLAIAGREEVLAYHVRQLVLAVQEILSSCAPGRARAAPRRCRRA